MGLCEWDRHKVLESQKLLGLILGIKWRFQDYQRVQQPWDWRHVLLGCSYGHMDWWCQKQFPPHSYTQKQDYLRSSLIFDFKQSALTPKFCSASWAFSITQMLRDRIYRKTKGKTEVDFSVQALLNCGLGSCEKESDPFEALSFIHKNGIPEEGCQNYMADRPVR